MSKLLNLVRRAPKRSAAILIAVIAAIIVPAGLLAWGPSRATFTEQVPASYVTFDSITNNSFYGDERNFATIKDASNTGNGGWQDNVTAQPGHTYVVRMYVHNNAASNLNLVAKNVRAMAAIGDNTGKSVSISSYISADNANPTQVWDDVKLTSDKDFNLVYVAGSGEYFNNKLEGAALPDSLATTSGAQLGYDKLDGNIPGCYEYSGYVYFKVQPQFATETTDFSLTKQVRKEGDTGSYKKSIDVNPGDTVNYMMTVKNTGNANLTNVNLQDQLPNGVTMVPGTAAILDSNNPNSASLQDGDKITSSGVNIGAFAPGSNAYVVFDAKVADNDNLPVCGPNTLTNTAIATPEGQSSKQDTADVTVNRTCAPGKINVCDLTSRQVVVINESDFDSSKYSKNLADCTSVPTELPKTGIDTGIAAFAGIGALTAGLGYALTSTKLRKLLQR